MIRLAVLTGCVLVIQPVMAEPPPGADEALAPWYRSWSQPATGSAFVARWPTAVTWSRGH